MTPGHADGPARLARRGGDACAPSQAPVPVLISLPTNTQFPPVLQIVRSAHEFGPATEFSLPTPVRRELKLVRCGPEYMYVV